jgi:hypothetical protein
MRRTSLPALALYAFPTIFKIAVCGRNRKPEKDYGKQDSEEMLYLDALGACCNPLAVCAPALTQSPLANTYVPVTTSLTPTWIVRNFYHRHRHHCQQRHFHLADKSASTGCDLIKDINGIFVHGDLFRPIAS